MLSAVPLVLLLALTQASPPGPAAWEPERAPAEDEVPASAPTLAEVRARLAETPRLDKDVTLGPISLRGFHWSQEIALGTRWRAVVVACQLGGGILVFDAAGRLAGSWRTWCTSRGLKPQEGFYRLRPIRLTDLLERVRIRRV